MIVFKYKNEFGRNQEVIKRPVCDVYLRSNRDEWIEFHPYIDSGADMTLIPLSLGKLIGLSTDKKSPEKIGGISGSIPVIYHEVMIKIARYRFPILISWAQIEKVPPLLGRKDIFDFFNVSFRQKKGIVIFEKA